MRLKFVREKVLRATTRQVEALAKEAGVEASHVSVLRYEKGERTPGADYVAMISETAGISPEWLLLGTGPRERPEATGAADPYVAGMAHLAARVIGTLEDALADRAPVGRCDPDRAIFREAANRLREIGAAARSLRQPEESESS